MWSQSSILGKPALLVVDGSGDRLGWESEFCKRVFNVLRRKRIALVGEAPLKIDRPEGLSEALQDQSAFNCIFLLGHGERVSKKSNLSDFWAWLSNFDGLTSKLLAACTFEDHDPETSRSILSAEDSFAQFAVVPESPISPRAAGLFFMKFFTELEFHAPDAITGRMVWFSHAKARELLRKRRLAGELGIRC